MSRIEVFELGKYFRAGAVGHVTKPNQRSIPNELRDVVRDTRHESHSLVKTTPVAMVSATPNARVQFPTNQVGIR
jgi:hypothetical protein